MKNRPARNSRQSKLKATVTCCVRDFLLLTILVSCAWAEGNPLTQAAKRAQLPFYVYGDESGKLSEFIPSGYMGDITSLSSLTSATDASAPVSTGRTGHTSLKISYSAKGKEGWAGIYWLTPANNWGTLKGAGFNLKKAIKLTFWARGEKGGEKLSQVKVGGVNGPYPDSDVAWLGPITLTKEWQQYTIELKGKDLHFIIGGFMFFVRRADNPTGATFYMDGIVYRGNPEDEVEPTVAVVQVDIPTNTSGLDPRAPVKVAAGKDGQGSSGQKDLVPVERIIYLPDPASIPKPSRWLKYVHAR